MHAAAELSTIPFVLDQSRLRQLLEPFALDLSSAQSDQILAYLQLLLRWNQKINLTAIRDPEECVTRHFGESLFLARPFHLYGDLLDIGSGAGFPGLALKIALPEISVTLIEPVAKKEHFLRKLPAPVHSAKSRCAATVWKIWPAPHRRRRSTLPPCAPLGISKCSSPLPPNV